MKRSEALDAWNLRVEGISWKLGRNIINKRTFDRPKVSALSVPANSQLAIPNIFLYPS